MTSEQIVLGECINSIEEECILRMYKNLVLATAEQLFFFDEQLIVTCVSTKTLEASGFYKEEVVGKPVAKLLKSLKFPVNIEVIKALLDKGIYTNRFESEETTEIGHPKWYEYHITPVRTKEGKRLYHTVVADITEKEENVYIKTHDALTGLFNRGYYIKKLHELDNPANLPLTVMVVKLNNLRLVNEVLGYQIGNELLTELSGYLREIVPETAIASRLESDEFGIIFPKTFASKAKSVMDKFLGKLANKNCSKGMMTLSIGYATKQNMKDNVAGLTLKAERHSKKHEELNKHALAKKAIDAVLQNITPSGLEKDRAFRLSNLCLNFAKAIHIKNEDEIMDIVAAAYMHNIGKATASPIEIENDEYIHTSYKIAKTLADSANAANILVAHNEAWDGTGHPFGLKGKSIPTGARIYAICKGYIELADSVCELTEDDTDRILLTLKESAGGKFDPALLDVFINAIKSKKIELLPQRTQYEEFIKNNEGAAC